MQKLKKKSVFFVSGATGITAETFAHSILVQFSHAYEFIQIRQPYITTKEKAQMVCEKIANIGEKEGESPLVFSTIVDEDIAKIIQNTDCVFMDLFEPFTAVLRQRLLTKPLQKQGVSHSRTNSPNYENRIEAINFTLEHDDGQFVYALDHAQIILVGVSRSAKTPTSLYLAMQYGVKVANYPLTDDDFANFSLPNALLPYKNKLFGLTIDPHRLAEIRNERMPNSEYANIINCKNEVKNAEFLMKLNNIPYINITNKSIEEVTTTLLDIFNIRQ